MWYTCVAYAQRSAASNTFKNNATLFQNRTHSGMKSFFWLSMAFLEECVALVCAISPFGLSDEGSNWLKGVQHSSKEVKPFLQRNNCRSNKTVQFVTSFQKSKGCTLLELPISFFKRTPYLRRFNNLYTCPSHFSLSTPSHAEYVYINIYLSIYIYIYLCMCGDIHISTCTHHLQAKTLPMAIKYPERATRKSSKISSI